MKTSKFKVIVPVLIVCLAVSLVFNVYPFFNKSSLNTNSESPKTKTFVFLEINQYLFADGVTYRKRILNSSEFLRVEVTFNWETSNLTVTAKVNDDDYARQDYLGLAFDANEDRHFEKIFALFADNTTLTSIHAPVLTEYGGIIWLTKMAPNPSTWHYCIFNETEYFFYFSIPKATINFHSSIPVHLCFGDLDAWLQSGYDNEKSTAYWEFEVKT